MIPQNTLTDEEKDLKQHINALVDYIRDLFLLSGSKVLEYNKDYALVKDYIGDRVIEIKRTIHDESQLRNKTISN